jgi:hypothetical protein
MYPSEQGIRQRWSTDHTNETAADAANASPPHARGKLTERYGSLLSRAFESGRPSVKLASN